MHDELSFNPQLEMSPIYGTQYRFARHLLPLLGAGALAAGTGGAATAGAAAGGSSLLGPLALLAGGGALGGLLGGEKTSKVEIPRQVTDALNALLSIGQRGAPELPVQQFPGLTGTEGTGLDLLNRFITSGPGTTFEDAKSRITQFLDQPGDITQRPEFQAILRASKDQGNEAVNQVLRRIQLSGLSGSSPQGKAVGRQVSRSQENLVGQLAPFAESERNRRFQALNQLLNIGQFEAQRPLDQIGAAFQFGQIPRQIETARESARFSTAQQSALFPFREQADIFSRILGSPASQPIVTDPSSSTTFSNVLGGAGATAKLLPFLTNQKAA